MFFNKVIKLIRGPIKMKVFCYRLGTLTEFTAAPWLLLHCATVTLSPVGGEEEGGEEEGGEEGRGEGVALDLTKRRVKQLSTCVSKVVTSVN